MRVPLWKRVVIALAIVVAVLGVLFLWFAGARVVLAGAIALTIGVFFGIVRLTAIRDVMIPPKTEPGATDPPPAAR